MLCVTDITSTIFWIWVIWAFVPLWVLLLLLLFFIIDNSKSWEGLPRFQLRGCSTFNDGRAAVDLSVHRFCWYCMVTEHLPPPAHLSIRHRLACLWPLLPLCLWSTHPLATQPWLSLRLVMAILQQPPPQVSFRSSRLAVFIVDDF